MNDTIAGEQSGKILVVDDTTANLQLLTNLLTEHGYTVYPASDGELALEFVRTVLPDLVLLDIRMPGIDGYEVCRRLKADERTRGIPVIFISALEEERDKVRGFREGAVDYIGKPFQPEETLARIQTHLRLRELTERLEQKVAERTAELQHEMEERKRAEEELRRSLQFVEGVINAIPDILLELDLDGRYLNVWTQKPELLIVQKEMLLGRTVYEVMSPESAAIAMDSIREAEEDGFSFGKVIRIDLPPGPHWFEISASRKPGGVAGGATYIILSRDITGRTITEQRLKQALEFTEGVINAIPDILFEVNREGRYLNVWTHKPELLAAHKEALLGRTIHDVLSPEEASVAMGSIREAEEKGVSLGNILRVDLPQGTSWFELSVSRKPGGDPSDVRFIALSRDVTGRMRMETELRESEARYRHSSNLLASILESASSVSVYALDREYRYLAFNRRHREGAKHLWGADIAVGMSMLDAIDTAEHREFCRQGFDRVLAGHNFSIESREVITKDGQQTVEYRDNYGSPIFNDDGEAVGLTVFAINTTERKRMETELEHERLLLKALLKTIPDPVWLKDPHGVFLICSDAFARLFDTTEAALIGTTDYDYVAPELAAFFQRMDREAMAAGRTRINEEWVTFAGDGHEALWETIKTPLHDAHGGVVGVLGVARDITDRKRMEEQLRFSEQQFRTLAENLPGMIMRYDRECRRIYANPAFARETGIPAEMALGLSPEDIWMGAASVTAGDYTRVLRRVMADGAPAEMLLEWPNRETGALSSHLINIVAERGAGGEIEGCLAICHNITALKEVELRLTKLAETSPGVMYTLRMKPDGSISMPYASPRLKDLLGLHPEDVAEDISKAFDLIHPDDIDGVRESMAEAARTFTSWRREFRVSHPAKGEIWLEGHASPTSEPDGGILWYGFLHGITGRKQSECVNMARLRLFQFAATNSMDELIEAILDEAEALTGSLIGFYHFIEDDQKRILLQSWSTRTKAEFCKAEGKGKNYDVSFAGVWFDCFRERRPVIHNDYASLHHRGGLPPGHAPVVRELVVPVFRGDKIVAILGVGNKPHDYTSQDLESIRLLTDLTWEIIERKRGEEALLAKRTQLSALAAELSLAEERERQNIAAMLHDHIGQTLLLARIKLGTLAKEITLESDTLLAEEAKELLDQVTRDIHNLTVQMNPPILAAVGLEAALEWLGRRMEEDYGLFVEFEDDLKEKPLLDEVRSVVYQCGRELLINAAKHAGTEYARIVVAREKDRYRLTVEDDGAGFDPATLIPDASKDCRFGLLSIQIRMERMGGSVVFDSAPGEGSRMTLLAPLAHNSV